MFHHVFVTRFLYYALYQDILPTFQPQPHLLYYYSEYAYYYQLRSSEPSAATATAITRQ